MEFSNVSDDSAKNKIRLNQDGPTGLSLTESLAVCVVESPVPGFALRLSIILPNAGAFRLVVQEAESVPN